MNVWYVCFFKSIYMFAFFFFFFFFSIFHFIKFLKSEWYNFGKEMFLNDKKFEQCFPI